MLSFTHNSPVARSKTSHRKRLRMCIPDCRGRHLLHKKYMHEGSVCFKLSRLQCSLPSHGIDAERRSLFFSFLFFFFPLLQARPDAARVIHAKQYMTKQLVRTMHTLLLHTSIGFRAARFALSSALAMCECASGKKLSVHGLVPVFCGFLQGQVYTLDG